MAYLGKTPSQAVRQKYTFTASGGETSISGADDSSNTLSFTDGEYVDVYLNGVLLVAGTDYNTTTANTIGGLSALSASDVVEIVVYDTFSVFGGDVQGDLTVSNGTLTSGDVDINGGTIDGVTIGGASAGAGTFTTLNASGDVNFDSNTLFVDASANAVGIGRSDNLTSKANISDTVTGDFSAVQLINDEPDGSADAVSIDFTLARTGGSFRNAGQIIVGKERLYDFSSSCDSYMAFETMDGSTRSEAMRIDSSGHVIAPEGITLGTAVGTYSAANTLDDYEEGTATMTGFSVTTGLTDVSHNYAFYTKVGNLVHIQGQANITCSGTGRKAFVMNVPTAIYMHVSSSVGQLGVCSTYPNSTYHSSGYILDNSGSNRYAVYVEFDVDNSAQSSVIYQMTYRTE